jgi:hypothetical protein
MRATHHRLIFLMLLLPHWLPAQTPMIIQPGAAMQLQLQMHEPGVDVTTPVTATAEFDPPVVHAGQKSYYRVQLNATEASIDWPELSPPPGLKFGPAVHGQRMQFLNGLSRAYTGFTHEVMTAGAGHFTITNFNVLVDGRAVEIPAASLEVVTNNTSDDHGQRIFLRASKTNLFVGEPFLVSLILPPSARGQMEPLTDIQINGEGFIPDKMSSGAGFEPINLEGQLRTSFVSEMSMTPAASGYLKFSAQAFASPMNAFAGTIVIKGPGVIAGGTPAYVLLMSDPLTVNVRPLPADNVLPGFTGSIGQFISDPSQLSTNRLQVGQPVHLKLSIHGLGSLTRLLPPLTPRSRDWQAIADVSPALGFTFIPLTDDVQATPEIPYSYFDPAAEAYVDMSIPAIPVTMTGQGLPVQLEPTEEKESNVPLKLSDFAGDPGETISSLKPPQLRGWFVAAQFLPVLGLFALLRWDRHRRFLAARPELVRRRQARKELRREKRRWRLAIAQNDAAGFVQSAANAMRIACAPHFPANPRALVCADVLAQLEAAEQSGPVGETVRKIFAVANARYAATSTAPVDLLSLEAKVDTVLMRLEEKL